MAQLGTKLVTYKRTGDLRDLASPLLVVHRTKRKSKAKLEVLLRSGGVGCNPITKESVSEGSQVPG